MRPFTAAAVQLAPAPGPLTPESVAANLEAMVDITRRCHAATGAELIVLPESATTGFTPACSIEQLWELMSELPGPVIDPLHLWPPSVSNETMNSRIVSSSSAIATRMSPPVR